MNKITNKKASLKCDHCGGIFNYKNMYAIGFRHNQVCGECWEIVMGEIINEQPKKI